MHKCAYLFWSVYICVLIIDTICMKNNIIVKLMIKFIRSLSNMRDFN